MTTAELQEGFQAQVDEHKKILFKDLHSYCRDRDEREDLAQEIIVQLWRSFPQLRPVLVILHLDVSVVALNVAISFHRRERTRNRHIVTGGEHLLEVIDETERPPEEVRLLYQFIQGRIRFQQGADAAVPGRQQLPGNRQTCSESARPMSPPS